ncbi:MAG TPA: 50S ribosomal protein L30 [Anaerolineales bacterium]|nr:50S ribosomal protein L30 [Anaerolineales bacterium]
MAKAKSSVGKIKITLVRSSIGYPIGQKRTVLALGLHRINQTVEHNDTPAVRGMVNKVIHLLSVEG